MKNFETFWSLNHDLENSEIFKTMKRNSTFLSLDHEWMTWRAMRFSKQWKDQRILISEWQWNHWTWLEGMKNRFNWHPKERSCLFFSFCSSFTRAFGKTQCRIFTILIPLDEQSSNARIAIEVYNTIMGHLLSKFIIVWGWWEDVKYYCRTPT